MKRTLLLVCLGAFILVQVRAQSVWKFAHLSDIHVGSEHSEEDLQRTVKDINANPELEFVVITGDITEFGADKELLNAKSILDGLNKPWYIIPGNHDMNWSESGGNSFKTVFGSETFAVKQHGILFLGTNCGPNMRMSPGQVPRENLVWLDSVLKTTPKETPIIFANHYPIDSALNNWYEVINRLKTRNIQLIICGHGHSNHHLNFEGIPGVMGRSNLRAKDTVGGYNIVSMVGDSVFYNTRLPGVVTKPTWTKDRLYDHHFNGSGKYVRPNFSANQRYANVKEVWAVEDNSDIGAGSAVAGNLFITPNTAGWLTSYDTNTGKKIWATRTGGKTYSTPCVSGKYVVISSSNKNLYCFDLKTGKAVWKVTSDKPMVASPVIKGDRIYCGSSDGHFKCYELASGKVLWEFAGVEGFETAKPLLYNGLVYFGAWANHLYALDQKTGALVWNWTNGSSNRMFSPASCYPVATANRLFIVAPDRYMTCIDATTGKVIWRKQDAKIKVRESMGLSADSSLVYVKTMDGDVLGISTKADDMQVAWTAQRNIGYDISPTLVEEHDGLVFAASNSGIVYAFNRIDGSVAWIHKVSNCLVNPLSFIGDKQLVATTMDGKIVCLKY